MTPPTAAADLLERLRSRRHTLAAAESLTGGLFLATLVEVPGASLVVRGGVVVYATDLKATLGGMDPDLLERVGPVSAETAEALAAGVRRSAGATWGVSMTGVAGPEPQDGHPVGTVHLGLAGPDVSITRRLLLVGDRPAIRLGTVRAAIALMLEHLHPTPRP